MNCRDCLQRSKSDKEYRIQEAKWIFKGEAEEEYIPLCEKDFREYLETEGEINSSFWLISGETIQNLEGFLKDINDKINADDKRYHLLLEKHLMVEEEVKGLRQAFSDINKIHTKVLEQEEMMRGIPKEQVKEGKSQ